MSIQFAHPLAAGNAVQLHLAPPRGAVWWRVLRRAVNTFAGPDDPQAAVVATDSTDTVVSDILGLVNGTPYFYRVYYRTAARTWLPAFDAATVTPEATYRGDELDPQALLRTRLELGLAVEVTRGRLRAPPKRGRIEVLTAPFALADSTEFPVVSVHVETIAPEVRGIGEVLIPDSQGPETQGFTETSGWLARIVLNVAGVSRNPDERMHLRRAIARVVQANLPVFDVMGLLTVDFRQTDHEEPERFGVPLYFTLGVFSCLAPSWVSADTAEIEEVIVTALDYAPET